MKITRRPRRPSQRLLGLSELSELGPRYDAMRRRCRQHNARAEELLAARDRREQQRRPR